MPENKTKHKVKLNHDIYDLKKFYSTYSNELLSKVRRIDDVIGSAHWLTVGSYKESILRDLLKNLVPGNYQVGTGFVIAIYNGKKILSKQIDILIWDSNSSAPIFRDGDFVIIPPETCKAAIEVKSTLDSESFQEGFENLNSLMNFMPYKRPDSKMYKALFCYKKSRAYSNAESVQRKLVELYAESSDTIESRTEWSIRNRDSFHLPWIDNVACLEIGSTFCIPAKINGKEYMTLHSEEISNQSNDVFGFMLRQIMNNLLKGTIGIESSSPGWADLINVLYPEAFKKWSIITNENIDLISQIGTTDSEFIKQAQRSKLSHKLRKHKRR